jgi:hypothetical protein
MLDIWLEAAEGTLLGFDAQRVIALSAMKIVAAVLRLAAKSVE